jgi:4-hydroxybenzoate polyprenyltransferase
MPTSVLPVWSPGFARAYVVTMRPYLLFVSGAAGLVGLAFVPGLGPGRAALAFVPLFLSYGLGQALTDCFQMDTDALSAPYRPLVAGVVSRRQVLAVSMAGLSAVVLVLAYLNPLILVLGAAAVLGLLTYTSLKRTWWGGPPWNSWIVALIPIMGRFVDRTYHLAALVRPGGWLEAGFGRSGAGLRAAAACPGPASDAAFALAVLAVFFGYANFVVMGYFKDISADRATGYRTFPVVFGWLPAAVYGDVTAAASAALTARVLTLVGAGAWSVVLFAAGLALHVWAQVAMHRTRDERETGGPIANGVRALVLYCLAIVAAARPGWIAMLFVFYFFFELVLRVRPERAQV